MAWKISLWLMMGVSTATLAMAEERSASEYLSDLPERLVTVAQGWGELGYDTAAHQSSLKGEPLRIGAKTYAKGLGHHANGAIVVLLDGEYGRFEAETGLQPCAGGSGSVVFRVYVDGEPRFDSGPLRTGDEPKALKIDVSGAQELRLEATNAGDGIACDMANWANARLTRENAARRPTPAEGVEVGRFARVVFWDPNRKDGSRASRIEEYRAEDLFLEREAVPSALGDVYTVPTSSNGLAAAGLQWLNRRALKELRLSFSEPSVALPTDRVRVEGWFGESAWQGEWKALAGKLETVAQGWVFHPEAKAPSGGLLQLQKVRWVFPAAGDQVQLKRPLAFTRSRWAVTNLIVQFHKPEAALEKPPRQRPLPGAQPAGYALVESGKRVDNIAVYNGDFAGTTATGDLSKPLSLAVRFAMPSSLHSDDTVLRFELPTGDFGVAMPDVLTNECVYLPHHGVFVAREPASISLEAYRRKIARQPTILEEVRSHPDQTLAQAMAKTHHEAQREGPVMLSLACDNHKFVVERNGMVWFQSGDKPAADWFGSAGTMQPTFGEGKAGKLTRRLEGNWLPMPVITVEAPGIVYSQRAFVAPTDAAGADPGRLNRPSVCVVEFTITNTQTSAANAQWQLAWLAKASGKQPAELVPHPRGYAVNGQPAIAAIIDTNGLDTLQSRREGHTLTFSGTLPAGRAARCVAYLPAGGATLDPAGWPNPDALKSALKTHWEAALAPAAHIDTPDPLLNDIIRSSQVRCLIAARNEADGARIAPWIAAMSYGPLESEAHAVIRGMDFLGHEEFARRGLEFFIHRYHTNGFLTTGYTTFGTGWHLWTLGEHFQLSHDTNWLRRVAPAITRAGHWIVRQLEKTRRTEVTGVRPESGLMPPGVLADWNAFAYHFCLNAYYYAALRELGGALTEIGDRHGLVFTQAAGELRENILQAYRWTQAQSPALALRNGAWIPHYPSQVHSPGKLADFFPGQDAGRSWCYDVELGAHQMVPTGVLAPQDQEVTRLLDHMEEAQFLADGWFDYSAEMNQGDWFNLGGFSKVQPYYTRNAEIYALRDEVKPFIRSYFNAIASLLNPEVLTFWEHFHHSGAWDKTHETGYFLHQTRLMLAAERGGELWLAPLISSNWLRQGMVLTASNLPTRFGKVSYALQSETATGLITAQIQPPERSLPAKLVLRLRHPEGRRIRAVEVNGRPHREFDRERVLLPPRREPIRVRVEY